MSLDINCPLCKSTNSEISLVTKHVYGRKGSAFYLCDLCEIIFQYPKLSERDEKIFYKRNLKILCRREPVKKILGLN